LRWAGDGPDPVIADLIRAPAPGLEKKKKKKKKRDPGSSPG
jgi:hypothetical protein